MSSENQKPSWWKRIGLWLLLLIIALVFLFVVGINQMAAKKKAEAAANMPESSALVTVTQVGASEWTPVIEAVGYVHPNQGAMLSSQNAGTVTKVLVKSGQRVTKGQLLVELDSTVEQATLKQVEVQLPAAQANYTRFRNLVSSNSASQAELDSAQSTYNQILANIESLKSTIKRRQLYAPFDGEAGIVNVNVGEYITNGTDIVRVEDRSKMKVRFTLPQTDIGRIKIGQRVTITADAIEGETFEAKISAIDPAVNRNNGLVTLEAVVNGKGKLMSGMFTRLRVALPTETEQVVVPQIAVTYTMYGETAYVVYPLSDDDKATLEKQGKDPAQFARARQVEVKTVDRQGVYAQLKGGINVGDTIVTSGFQRMRNNGLIQISDKQPAGLNQPAKETRL